MVLSYIGVLLNSSATRINGTSNRLEQAPALITTAANQIPRPLGPLMTLILCFLSAILAATAVSAWQAQARPVVHLDAATVAQQIVIQLQKR